MSPRTESGDVSPHSTEKACAISRSAKTSAHELAACAKPLVVCTGHLHGYRGHLPKTAAPEFTGAFKFFLASLFRYAEEFHWSLHAWAVLANHYHFIATSPPDPRSLRKFLGKLHMKTAQELNRQDDTPGRKVWYQFWDSHITFEKSYLARLHYVHSNPAKHGVVDVAENYQWCSASWFARNASPAFVQTVKSFKTDQLEIPDDF